MAKIVENITELVGNSPIIKLKNSPENSAEIYLKLEYFNPGGSVKDRIALQMIRQAEQGTLEKRGNDCRAYFWKYRDWTCHGWSSLGL